MDTQQLLHILKDCGDFIGVFSLDNLPTVMASNSKFIVNTQTSNLPGEHWISVSGSHLFDPLGLHYPEALMKHMYKYYNKLTFNRNMYQRPTSDLCGQFCCFSLLFPYYKNILLPYIFDYNERVVVFALYYSYYFLSFFFAK
jgi:hypothetical protein